MKQEENENGNNSCDLFKWVHILSIRKYWGQENLEKGNVQKKKWEKADILNTAYFHRIKKWEGEKIVESERWWVLHFLKGI